MIYKYTIGASDLMTLNKNYETSDPAKSKGMQRLKIVPAFVMAGMLLANYLTRGYFSLGSATVLGAFFVLWYLYADKMLEYFMKRRVHKLINSPQNKWLTKERTMNLNDDHFIERIEGAESSKIIEMKYADLNRVDITKDAIYLFVDELNSYIMPIRAFSDETEMRNVYDFLKSKMTINDEVQVD